MKFNILEQNMEAGMSQYRQRLGLSGYDHIHELIFQSVSDGVTQPRYILKYDNLVYCSYI